MKRPTIAILFVLAASIATAGGAWKTFNSPDGSFSVAFPATPMVKRMVQTMKGMQLPTEIAAVGSGDRAYMTVKLDYSKIPQLQGRQNDVLDFGIAGLSKDKGYQIYSQDSFQIGNNPGRHVVLRKGQAEQQVYVVCKGDQAIMIIVAAKPGQSDDQEARKFISSFKLR